jgi:hypothetical protein
MNNKEIMVALLKGYKICNPNWGCKYAHLVGNNIVTDDGSPMNLNLAYRYSGQTRVYIDLDLYV